MSPQDRRRTERGRPVSLVIDSTVKTVKVKIEIDVDELRHWAGKHADAGHAGVAHVLYKAAEGIESLTSRSAIARLIRREIARAEGTTP